jgi:hypothetical protein
MRKQWKAAYQELCSGVATAAAVYTDDTGCGFTGNGHLMTFDTDQATVYHIRGRHRNQGY